MKGRKILAWLLAMTMVLTMLPVSVFAGGGLNIVGDSEVDFGSSDEGYEEISYKSITIQNNTGNQVTLTLSGASNYDYRLSSSQATTAAGQTAMVYVRPKTNLTAGTYNETLTIASDAGGYTKTVSLKFTVTGSSSGDDLFDDTSKIPAIGRNTYGIAQSNRQGDVDKYYDVPQSYIYFGVNSTDNNTPIKWRVLDATKSNNGDGGMFLLSEYVLASGVEYGGIGFYQNSNAKKWCNDFATNKSNFSDEEQGVMLSVSKEDNGVSGILDMDWGSCLLNDDKLFLLSAEELADYVGNYDGAPGLAATDTENKLRLWWLRSPDTYGNVGVIDEYGYSMGDSDTEKHGARPAVNLNPGKIGFISAANGGKAVSGMESGLTKIPGYKGNEWKLTLFDEYSNFYIDNTQATNTTKQTGYADWTVSVPYYEPQTGDNYYISAVLADTNRNYLYYGRITKPTASEGTAAIKIPSGLAAGDYTLYVFNEQYNGDYKTDYISSFGAVSLTVAGNSTGGGDSTGGDDSTPTVEAPAGYTTDSHGLMAYRSDAYQGYDFKGYVGDGWKDTSYHDHDGGFSAWGFLAGTYNGSNLGVTAEPSFIADGKAIRMDYLVTNNGDQKVSDYRFYITADTAIGEIETASCKVSDGTLTMTSGDLAFFVFSTTNGTPAGTESNYYEDDMVSYQSIAANGADPSKVTAASSLNDSAFVMYFDKDTLEAGSSKTYTMIVGLGKADGIDDTIKSAVTAAGGDSTSGGDSTGDDSTDAAAAKAIQLGTNEINSPTKVEDGSNVHYLPNSYIYFGLNGTNPIKWRVLDAAKANDGTTNGLFLLSEDVVGTETAFGGSSQYKNSSAQTWCSNFVGNTSNFSQKEQDAIQALRKIEGVLSNTLYGISPWGSTLLSADKDKMFFLSVTELSEYVGNYNKAPGLGASSEWWLRSSTSSSVGSVTTDGTVHSQSVSAKCAARPAMNLDSSKILFISSPDGKSATVGSSLTKVSGYKGNEWKLTLKDSNRQFSIKNTGALSVKAGDTIGMPCSGVTIGSNNYISVIIEDSNKKAVYYGKVKETAAEAAQWGLDFKIPEALEPGDYTLHVFSEQCNGDYKTDYASAFCDVKLTVKAAGEAQIGNTYYATLAEALQAAADNDTADTIKIVSESVTDVTGAELKAGDSLVTYGGNEYKATTDAKVSIDEKGTVTFTDGTVQLVKGEVTLGDGESITVGSGKTITNPEDTGSDTITVKADSGKDTVTVNPSNTVKIGDNTYINSSPTATMEIEVTESCNKLTAGQAALNDGESITGKISAKVITNPANSGDDTITVVVAGKDMVVVPANGKVSIGGTEYDVGNAEQTIFFAGDDVELSEGSVTLNPGESIKVMVGGVYVTNPEGGDKDIVLNAGFTENIATVPEGGQINLGGAKITDVKQETTFAILGGNVEVKLAKDETITINGVVYTGGEDGGKITIDPIEKNEVIGVEGINLTVSEDKLTADFSYVILPGQSVTIGKYVYSAPADGNWGDVTIWGRGADENGKFFTPAVVIKNANGTVDVALSENPETTTTYTAENANTWFAMSADDTDTTKVELLDNGADAKSALKFTDTKSHVVNGVTYQAQTVKDAETGGEKAVAYTVVYGEVTNEDESVSNRNIVSVGEGSKVIVTMNTGNSIQVNDKSVTATNNGASIIIDSTDSENANAITGNRSNLTEIKDEEGTVTGYEVRKRSSSGGGGSSSSASSYTVKFETNGGSELKNISVKNGQAIGTITAPTKNGYVFTGWYSDKELTKKYDDETKVTASTTLYAGWKVDPVRQLVLTIGKKDATAFGQSKSNDVAPKIVKDRTMLPARFVAENLGAKVEWNEEKQLVTITGKNLQTGKDVTILITIGSDTATVNGENVKLDSPSFIENDRTYTPVRFISEELGASVEWDEATQQVIITKALASEEK